MLIFPNRHRASRSRNRNEINSNRALTGSCDSHAKSWMSLNNLEDDLLNEDYKNVILTSDSNKNLAKFDETPALDDNVFDEDDVEMRKKYFSAIRFKSLKSKKIYADYDYTSDRKHTNEDGEGEEEEADLLGTKHDEAIIESLLNDIEFELAKKSSNNSSICNSPQLSHMHCAQADNNHSNRKAYTENGSLPNTPPILLNVCTCRVKCDCLCHLYGKRSESLSSRFSSSSNRTPLSVHLTSSHESLDWDMSLDLESHVVEFDTSEIISNLNERISKLRSALSTLLKNIEEILSEKLGFDDDDDDGENLSLLNITELNTTSMHDA
jgi:hypothetical protein